MAEEKKKLSAKEVLADIRAGASDEFLMKKYGISEKGLQSLFQKLITAKVLTQAELDSRASAVKEVEPVIVEDNAPVSPKEKSVDVLKDLAERFKFSKEDLERLKTASLKDIKQLMEKYNISLSDSKELLKTLGISAGTLLTHAAGKLKEGTRRLKEELQQRQSTGEKEDQVSVQPKPAENPQEQLKKVGGQAVDKAKELRDKAREKATRAAQKFLGVLKTAAIVGIVGILGLGVVGLGGYLIYKKVLQKPRITQTTTGSENIDASEPKDPCSKDLPSFPIASLPAGAPTKEVLATWLRVEVFKYKLLDDPNGYWQDVANADDPNGYMEKAANAYHFTLGGRRSPDLTRIIEILFEQDYGCVLKEELGGGRDLASWTSSVLESKCREAFRTPDMIRSKKAEERWLSAKEKEYSRKRAEDDTMRQQGKDLYVHYPACKGAIRDLIQLANAAVDQGLDERRKFAKVLREWAIRQKECEKRKEMPVSTPATQTAPTPSKPVQPVGSALEEAVQRFHCKSGEDYLKTFPKEDYQHKEVEALLSKPDPNYYYFYGLHEEQGMGNVIIWQVVNRPDLILGVDLTGFSLAYNPASVGSGQPEEMIGKITSIIKTSNEFGGGFMPVISPEIISSMGTLYEKR